MARLIDAALQDFKPELRDPPCWRSMRVADVSPSAWKDPRFVQVGAYYAWETPLVKVKDPGV